MRMGTFTEVKELSPVPDKVMEYCVIHKIMKSIVDTGRTINIMDRVD